MEVAFCPDGCEERFRQSLLESTEVLCAFYDLDSEVWPLEEDGLLVYRKNHEGLGRPVGGKGLMHHKFCVLDESRVLTGSMNPTLNGIHRNANNLLLINSTCAADAFLNEWEEVRDRDERGNPCPRVNLSGVLLEILFCPEDGCADRIIRAIDGAEEEVRFLTFSFTHRGIADALIAADARGVAVSGLIDASQTSYSVHEYLRDAEINVAYDQAPYKLHHKFFVVDRKTVITGSMNPSKNGDERNDENLLVVHDRAVAGAYLQEYSQRLNEQ